MAGNYNPRSGSSDFRERDNRKKAGSSGRYGNPSGDAFGDRRVSGRSASGRRSPSGGFADTSTRPYGSQKTPSSGRNFVEYEQSAKNDLSLPSKNDDRARYARYKKTDRPIRVLPDAGQSRFTERAGRRGGFADDFVEPAPEARRHPGSDRRGTTIREHRIRQSRATKPPSRAPRRILVAAIVIIVLVTAAAVTYLSPAFSIGRIEVKGTERMSDEYLRSLAGEALDTTLLRVDTDSLANNLLSEPWVAEVKVERSFPSTLTLVVSERQVVATVEISPLTLNTTTTYWLVSSDGLWLSEVDLSQPGTGAVDAAGNDAAVSEDGQPATGTDGTAATGDDSATTGEGTTQGTGQSQQPEAPLLENVNITLSQLSQVPRIREVAASVAPVAGTTVTDAGITNALAIINGLSADMMAMTRFISAPDRVKTMLTLTNNVEVAFGEAEDVAAKEQVIKALLEEHKGKIVYINVRVVNKVTYRSV